MAQNIPSEDKLGGDQETAIPSESDKVSLNLADLDDDEDPISGGDLGDAGNPLDRKGRRAQWREEKERRSAAEQRALNLEREVAELRGRVSAIPAYQPPQQYQGPTVDHEQAEIDAIWDQQQMVLRSMSSPNMTEDDVKKASEQWRKLDTKRHSLMTRREIRANTTQEDPSAAEDRVVNQMLKAEYPQIFQSPPMVNRAIAEMQELMAQRRTGKSPALAREACERVVERYNLRKGKAPPPSEAERARYTSTSSRAGSGGSSSGTYTPSLNVLRTARGYTKHLPDLSDEERVAKWYKEVGRPNGLT